MKKVKPADIVLRMPNFWVRLDHKIEYPAGQYDIYQKVRAESPTDPWALTKQVAHEYCSIAATMLATGEDFRIIDAYRHKQWSELRRRLRQSGAKFRRYDDIEFSRLAYPRDLAVYLPNGDTLMCWFDLDAGAIKADGIYVCLSDLGEGGRTLIRNNTALYPAIVELESEEKGKWVYRHIDEPKSLERANMRYGALLPSMTRPLKTGLINNHLDLYAGFLADPKGGLHLVVDPKLMVIKPDMSGIMTLSESRDAWQKVCDGLEIKLHFPKSITIPASTCFFQFPSGKVIMTGGDDEVAETVAEIIGKDNLFLTPTPVKIFPTFKGAGIRCVIGELPPWMRHLEKYRPSWRRALKV